MTYRTLLIAIALAAPTAAWAIPWEGEPETTDVASEIADEVSDGIVAARLRVALLNALGTDGLRVETTVESGRVYLDGQVIERSSRELAPIVAEQIDGVWKVHSDLKLIDGPTPLLEEAGAEVDDAVMAARVKTHLLLEAGADALDVQVDAADGVIILTGPVDSRAARDAVRKAAYTAYGVESVQDHTVVIPH